MTNLHDFKAALTDSNNYYIVPYLANKPYTHLQSWATGMLFGYFYIELLNYRKIETVEEKKAKHPIIHFLQNTPLLTRFLFLCGIVIIFVNFTIIFEASKDADNFSSTDNIIYFGISRLTFAIGVIWVWLCILLDHMHAAKRFLTNSYFRSMGKLSFETTLIYPIIILFFCVSQRNTYYVCFFSTMMFGMGNTLANILFAILLYLSIEYPFKNLIIIFIRPKITHDDMLRKKLCP
jgi:hypothetical protein